jgi:hypothetical protein
MVQTKKQKGPSKNKKRTRSKKSHKGGSSNADFMKAINKADLEYIQSNIKQMEDLSFEDVSGKTPLDNAVKKYNTIPYPISNADDFMRFDKYNKIIVLLLENGANGENITLHNFNFEKAKFKGVKLQGSDLRGSNFIETNLENADLSKATLRAANFSGADLEDANLSKTDVTNTVFDSANLDGTNLKGSNIEDAVLTNTIYESEMSADEGDSEDELEEMIPISDDSSNVLRTSTDLDYSNSNYNDVFRGTTDLPESYSPTGVDQTQESLGSREPSFSDELNDISFISEDGYDVNNISDFESPNNLTSIFNNGDWLDQENDTQEQQRREQRERRREVMKNDYLQREKITINKSDINPFPTVGMTGHDVIMMEDVKYCDYIKEDPNNLLFIFDKQVAMINRSQIEGFIANETVDESKIVYQCKQTDMAFIARQENIISGPTLNMDIIGLFGVMIPLNYLDEVVNQPHQIFIVETNNNRSKNPIASLNTRLATQDESGQAVVSANHCQVEVSIKLGQLRYIENNVLEKECAKSGGKKRISRRKKGKKGGKSKGSRKNEKTKKYKTKNK